MPELPEVETMARDLDRAVAGRRITGVRFPKSDVLREVGTRAHAKRVTGATIDHVWRRAKLLVIELSTGDKIAIQPRFTGVMLIDDAGSLPDEERKYSTVQWTLDDGRVVHYRDIRRLGTVALMNPKRFDEYTSKLGIEPFDPAFTTEHLANLLRKSRQAIKKVLMDQRVLAGVGNIYANEALWLAKVDPSRPANSVTPAEAAALHAAVVAVLSASIKRRGTSFRDYRDPSGKRGGNVPHLAAYGREGQPCLRCGTRLVGTHEIDGRATVLCPNCQR